MRVMTLKRMVTIKLRLRNDRPVAGIQNAEPRISSKKTEKFLPGPGPEFLRKKPKNN